MWIWHAILTNYNKKRIQKSTSWNFFKCSYRYLFLSMQELINMECSFDFSKTDTSLKLWQDWKGWIFVSHPRPFLLEGIKGLKKHGTGGYQEDAIRGYQRKRRISIGRWKNIKGHCRTSSSRSRKLILHTRKYIIDCFIPTCGKFFF